VRELLLNRRSIVWLLLVGATALSWKMGHGRGFSEGRWASAAIIALAAVKIRFVILDFMELRHSPLRARLVGETYVIALASALLAIYLTGTQG
jgi:hypothetical protein